MYCKDCGGKMDEIKGYSCPTYKCLDCGMYAQVYGTKWTYWYDEEVI